LFRRRFLCLFILVCSLLLLFPFVAAAETASQKKLFSIHRSINDNELIYEARMTSEGFDQSDPIHVFWVMNTKGGAIEPLTNLEKKRAYGVVLETVSKDRIQFSLKALPKKSVMVSRENGRVVSTLLINEEEAVIERIFIKTKPGGPIPPVEYVEIEGKSKVSGKSLLERFTRGRKKDGDT